MSTKRSDLTGGDMDWRPDCDWMAGIWIVACKRSGLERKRDVWVRCVQGWLKKYYPMRSEGGDFFKATCLPLLTCFAELRERLTNTL